MDVEVRTTSAFDRRCPLANKLATYLPAAELRLLGAAHGIVRWADEDRPTDLGSYLRHASEDVSSWSGTRRTWLERFSA